MSSITKPPKSEYQEENIQTLLTWARLPLDAPSHYRPLILHTVRGGFDHAVAYTHAEITKFTERVNTNEDVVTFTLIIKQKRDKFAGVLFGRVPEETYQKALANLNAWVPKHWLGADVVQRVAGAVYAPKITLSHNTLYVTNSTNSYNLNKESFKGYVDASYAFYVTNRQTFLDMLKNAASSQAKDAARDKIMEQIAKKATSTVASGIIKKLPVAGDILMDALNGKSAQSINDYNKTIPKLYHELDENGADTVSLVLSNTREFQWQKPNVKSFDKAKYYFKAQKYGAVTFDSSKDLGKFEFNSSPFNYKHYDSDFDLQLLMALSSTINGSYEYDIYHLYCNEIYNPNITYIPKFDTTEILKHRNNVNNDINTGSKSNNYGHTNYYKGGN